MSGMIVMADKLCQVGSKTRKEAGNGPADLLLDTDRWQNEMREWQGMSRNRVPVILPKPDERKKIIQVNGSMMMMDKMTEESNQSQSRNERKLKSLHPQYTGCRYDVAKPPYSYASLIAQALLAAPDKRLTLNQIYGWIMEKYPYYRSENSGWQNSIRHNLSLNSCFIKLSKTDRDNGKGSYWTVDEEELAGFKNGAFKRRKLLRSVSRRRKRRTNSDMNNSISVEPILPSICDYPEIIEESGFDDESPFRWTGVSMSCEQMRRVNDPKVNGSKDGLRMDDIFRASSPTNQNTTVISIETNRTMSVDILCPEMAEACVTFNTWEFQKNSSEIRTDYTDPLEILSRL